MHHDLNLKDEDEYDDEDWGLKIKDWGLRIEDWGWGWGWGWGLRVRIEDWGWGWGWWWGLRIEDWGLRIEDWVWGLRTEDEDWGWGNLHIAGQNVLNPQKKSSTAVLSGWMFFHLCKESSTLYAQREVAWEPDLWIGHNYNYVQQTDNIHIFEI